MGSENWLLGLGILACAAVSFFFALAESALFSLGKWRARQLSASPRGKAVLNLLQNPSELLGTIVLGNSVANAAIVSLALWAVLQEQWNPFRTMASVLLFILICCEVLPKTLAVRDPQKWSQRVAGPMLLLQTATGGFQHLVQNLLVRGLKLVVPKSIKPQSAVTEDDYQELLEMAYQQGTLAEAEKEIIFQIINLDQKTAADVMKPRSYMAALSDELSLEEMIQAAHQHKHRRLPIYDESPDTIVGVLNTKTLLLNPKADLAEAIEFPSFVPETMNLLLLLKSFQRQKRGLAIVLDEYGGTAGLVTVEDILEEVVGEIQSETQSAGFIMEKLDAHKWRVHGSIRLDDFCREYPPLGDVDDVDTMAGLMMKKLEVVPQQGQSVTFRGLRLTATIVDERRIQEILVERIRRK